MDKMSASRVRNQAVSLDYKTYQGYLQRLYVIYSTATKTHVSTTSFRIVGLEEYGPKVSERPHLEVTHRHVLFLLGQCAVLPWTPTPARWGRVGFWFCRRRRRVPYVVTLNSLLMGTRTWSTCPAVPTSRLGDERWLYAAHVEERLATVAADGFWSI
jgi:hypothetical protein